MVLHVRYGGDYVPVDTAPGASPQDVEEAVARRVGIAVGSFCIKNKAGVTSTFHAGLDSQWDVVPLPVQAAPGAAAGAAWGSGAGGYYGARARLEGFLFAAGIRPQADVMARLDSSATRSSSLL